MRQPAWPTRCVLVSVCCYMPPLLPECCTPWIVTAILTRCPVCREYSSPRVLTLEYLTGTKISDKQRLLAAGLDPIVIAQRATESYLIQILRHGFFHADPHPGNVAVDAAGNLLCE